MIKENWNTICTTVSTICAIIGVIFSLITLSNKRKAEKIKKDIEQYRNEIIKKSDLLLFVPKIDEIKEISNIFLKITTNKIPKEGDTKTELDYYGEIKNKTIEVLNDIPEEYKDIREILMNIKKAIAYCISKDKSFSELGRYDEYSYSYVEDNFSKVISKMNTLTREIKYK
ncbi:TPA: hypothetical protein ACF2C8_000796 [Clostridium perfringens]